MRPIRHSVSTTGSPNWSLIQSWYDTGYIEPASHSRNHPCSLSDYQATGYAFQILGSRDDILARLALRQPYVTTYIEPCGVTNTQIRQNIVAAGYLVDRGYPVPPAQNSYSPWGGDGAYARTLYSIDTEPWYGRESPDLLGLTNAAFDAAYKSGGIYHLLDHPWFELWYGGSYLSRHIDYVANRPDVWYTTLGGLYLYRFVTERGLMTAYAVGNPVALPTEIITNPPPAHTICDWPGNRKGAVSITFDDSLPSQLSLAVPELDARGIKGTFFLVTDHVDYDGTWAGWRSAAASGHEIGSHSVTHPNLTQLSPAALEAQLRQSKEKIESEIAGVQCLTFAYPFGASNAAVVAATARHYISARTTSWNSLNYKPYDIYNVLAVGDDYGHDLNFMAGMTDRAESTGAWLVVYLHSMNGDGYGSWNINILRGYLDYLLSKRVWVGVFGAVTRFLRERDSATLTVLSSSPGEIVLRLTDEMDNALYNMPLTLRSEVPPAWTRVAVQQGATMTSVTPVAEGGKNVIYYDAVPDAGLIILAPAGPVLASLAPQTVMAGSGGFVLNLTGANFESGAVVRWNGAARATTFVSGTRLQADIQAADVAAPGTASVSVLNPDGRSSNSLSFTIAAPSLTSLSATPATVTGGTGSSGSVTLNGPAPEGGIAVTLASSNPSAAAVPASVTMPAGSSAASFAITTYPVASSTFVTLTATYGASTRSTTLIVLPPALISSSVNPDAVTGGSSSTGSVMLDAAAPAGGIAVSLSSSNTAAAAVPSSVTVPAGSASTTFTVTTYPVASSTTVTITAAYAGATRTAALTVTSSAATVPGPPTSVTATAGNAQATVSFLPPASDGGSPIISYTVTSNPGGITATGSASPIVVAGLTNGTAYTFTVRATNAAGAGPASAPSNTVTPAGLAIDAQVWVDKHTPGTSITTPTLSTRYPNELLLAFVSSDGPEGQTVTVSSISNTGTPLTWVLVRRTNVQYGTAEIWRAFAAAPLTGTVTVRMSRSVFAASVTVVSFTGVDTTGTNGSGAIGATGSANALQGAPTASLVTTRPGSWVFGAGNDWDRAVARTLGPDQTMVHQDLGAAAQRADPGGRHHGHHQLHRPHQRQVQPDYRGGAVTVIHGAPLRAVGAACRDLRNSRVVILGGPCRFSLTTTENRPQLPRKNRRPPRGYDFEVSDMGPNETIPISLAPDTTGADGAIWFNHWRVILCMEGLHSDRERPLHNGSEALVKQRHINQIQSISTAPRYSGMAIAWCEQGILTPGEVHMKKLVGVLISMLAFCGVAGATPFGFRCITNNNATDCGIGEAQLWVDVLAGPMATQVDFVFHNLGPAPSSITDVYFDDGTLLGIAAIVNGTGVKFSQYATPSNLPGGNAIYPPFITTQGFSADSDKPVQINGVNPGEWLIIRFNLSGSYTLSDTLSALQYGSLRIGIHVQGFASGGSESFVNNPTPIPEPGSVVLMGCALALLGILAARRR